MRRRVRDKMRKVLSEDDFLDEIIENLRRREAEQNREEQDERPVARGKRRVRTKS